VKRRAKTLTLTGSLTAGPQFYNYKVGFLSDKKGYCGKGALIAHSLFKCAMADLKNVNILHELT
jgi:hypothetical protein